jgi:hypothetical protein
MKTALPWILAALLAAGMVAAIWNGRRLTNEAERLAEAATLKAQNFAVADQGKERALEVRAAEIGGLQAELARLRAASPGVKVRTVVRWKTAYLPAGGAPREPAAPGQPVVCVLAQGDEGQIRVDAVRAETKAGNVVAVGQAQAVRVHPPPETVLFGGPFEAALSSYTEAAVTPLARWSLGARGWWRNPGWTAEVSGGYRLAGPLWLEGAARFDSQFAAGVRWEIP